MPVVSNDGIEIPYAVQGEGGGPTLVFAHGLSGQGEQTRFGLAPLVDAGWTVVSFDQRGHADASPVLDLSGYDPVAMGSDLWAVADAAGIDRCWIGGGSMGAATSFRAATIRPDRVEGLVHACPALSRNAHPLVWMFDAFADQLRDGGIEAVIDSQTQLMRQLGAPEEAIERLEDLRAHDPASLETAFRSVPRWILDDVPSAFSGFAFPVIVIAWENDPIHPMSVANDVAAAAGVEIVELDFTEVLRDRALIGRVLVDLLPAVART